MKVAISNIAWEAADERAAAQLLSNLKLSAVEIAPGKIPAKAFPPSKAEIESYRAFWKKSGIEVVAMQALLFGRPDLVLFGSEEGRIELAAHLSRMIDIGAALGAKILVFGSPRNRQKGTLSRSEANEIAIPFFRGLGEHAKKRGARLCIEPNPKEYGADWVNTAIEAATLVRSVDSAGFGLHIDAGSLSLSRESLDDVYRAGVEISHFHISRMNLQPIGGEGMDAHAAYAKTLREHDYSGFCSIEMKSTGSLAKVKTAIEFARKVYA